MDKTFTTNLPILLVDDEDAVLKAMSRAFKMAGVNEIVTLNDSRKAPPILEEREFAFILLDLSMPYLTGDDLLEIIVEKYPETPVIMVTANDDVSTIVSCIKNGAFDYIVKPVDTGRLLATARCAIEVRELRRENTRLRRQKIEKGLENPDAFSEILTNSEKMLSVFQYLEAISHSSQPVVITGQTGVGKELIARAIHKLSGRTGNFVTVNIAGLDDNIFSDTLFGHVRGAYTGAVGVRSGLIKQASKGTLFLDEIGDLNATSQVKLLRLLQEREYMPLGSDKVERADARILVASNKNLDSLKETGDFRKDLYFRLSAHQVHIPPLRERLEDLPLLTEHFLEEAAQDFGKQKPVVPEELYTLLKTYPFQGNVRELRSLIFDALSQHKSGVMSLDVFRRVAGVETEAQPNTASQSPIAFGLKLPTMKEVRKLLAYEAIKRTDNNKTAAAGLIGITRQSLSQYLQVNKANKANKPNQ